MTKTLPKFRTSSNRHLFPKSYEPVDDEKIVETSGYITLKQRVENMLLAGERLFQYRKELYDIQHGEELDENLPVDPTRKDYDLADAFQDTERIKSNLNSSDSSPEEEESTVSTEETDESTPPKETEE